MLPTHEMFSEFTRYPISDVIQETKLLIALRIKNREEVDQVVQGVFSAGTDAVRNTQEGSFMYGRSFSDPDGHIWEIIRMDPSQIPVDGESL